MSKLGWLDRAEAKKKLVKWISSDSNKFLLIVKDDREIDDIIDWFELPEPGFKYEFKKYVADLNSDSTLTAYGLLDSIVSEIGRDKFPAYKQHVASLSSQFLLTIDASIAKGASASTFGTVDINAPLTPVNINIPDPVQSRINYYQENITAIFEYFINDLREAVSDLQHIIICKFSFGFVDAPIGFQKWFKNIFVTKMVRENLQLVVVCENNAGVLGDYFDDDKFPPLKDLEVNDIVPAATEYLEKHFAPADINEFCCDIVSEDNKITYTLFQYKLNRKINRQN